MANRKVLFRSGARLDEVSPSADSVLIASIDQGATSFTHKAGGVTLYTLATTGRLTMNGDFSFLPSADDMGTIGVDPGIAGGDPLGVGIKTRFHLVRARRIVSGATITMEDSIDIASSADGVGPASQGRIKYESGTQALRASENGAALDDIVLRTKVQTLTNKTFTAPAISDFTSSQHNHQNAAGGGQLDHGLALTGLGDDDHAQYALLAGRAGGQTLIGGSAASENLVFQSTSNATRGTITANDQFRTTATATLAAIRIGSVAGDPSTLANGDVWYNSTSGKFRGREAGTSKDLISAGSSGSLQGAYDNGVTITTTASGAILFTRGGTAAAGDELLHLVDANASAARTANALFIEDANTGTGVTFRTTRTAGTAGVALIEGNSTRTVAVRNNAANADAVIIDTTNARFGLNRIAGVVTFAPAFHFHYQTEGNGSFVFDTYATSGENFEIQGRKAEGTFALPTALSDDSDMWEFSAAGYDGVAFSGQQAVILFEAAGAWTGTNHGTRQVFKTTLNGSTALREVMVLGDDGCLVVSNGATLIGATAGEKLRVEGAARVTQPASTTGTPPIALFVAGGTHTTLTAAEAIDVDFSLTHTVQFTSGATIAAQRVVVFRAPTYAATAASQTITDAATVAITGAPIQGTNVILTRTWAHWVQGGASRYDGDIVSVAANHDFRAAVGDANPTQRQAGGSILTGAGGASALDTRLARTAASTWTVDNNAGGGSLVLSAVTGALYYESSDGAAAAVSGAATGRIRYNNSVGAWQFSTQGGAYASFPTGSGTANTIPKWTAGGVLGNSVLVSDANDRTLTYTPAASVAGSPTILLVTGPAHTTLTAAEAIDIDLNMARTVQFTSGATIASQRAMLFRAPTYSATAATQTITDAATIAVTGAPVAGTNVSITRSWSAWFQGGSVRFDGDIVQVAANNDFRAAIGDANPVQRQGGASILFGAGGASALDTRFARTSASAITIDNNAGGGTFVFSAVTGSLFYESSTGTGAAVSGAATGRLIYDNTAGAWRVSVQGGAYSNVLTVATLGTTSFLQGGNSFAATATFGTNDANQIDVRTGGVTRFTVLAASSAIQGNGGFTIFGGSGASETLTLNSTSNATKGKILFGASVLSGYVETTDSWGFGTVSPAVQWDFFQAASSATLGHLRVRDSTSLLFEADLQNRKVNIYGASATAITDGILNVSSTTVLAILKGNAGGDYSTVLRFAGEATDDWLGGYIQYDAAGNELIIGTHNTSDKLVGSDIESIRIARATGSIVPGADAARDFGSSTLRWTTVVANTHSVFGAPADANPTAQLLSGSLTMGPGAGTAVDTRMRRTGVSIMTFDNAVGGGAITISTVTGSLFYESADGAAAAVSGAATGRLRYNNTTATFQTSVQGGAYANVPAGSGTANRITKWSNTVGGLADSVLAADAGNNTLTYTPVASTSGSPVILTVTGPAHTTLTAAEDTDLNFNLARTVQFTSGATIANQRAVRFQAPTYGATAATQTITDAVTVSISGAPVQGTNVVLTRTWAMRVEAGDVRLDGNAVLINTNLDVRVAVGDANPSARVLSGGIALGVGGATALDTRMRRTAATTITFDNNSTGAVTIVPATDSQNALGTATLRWSTVAANTHNVFGAPGDANPTVQITTQSITMGPGAGTAVDTRLRRTAVSTFTIDNGSTGGATVVPATTNTGVLGTDALKWNRIRATSVVTGDLEMKDEAKGVHYILIEEKDGIYVRDMVKRKMYKIPMVEVPWRE